MRTLIAVPLLMLAAPAVAQPQAEPKRDKYEIPAELSSPETAKKLGKMAGVLSKALMDMEVGEIQAIAEGREPTAADKNRTVRDMAGSAAEAADIERQLANAGPIIEQSAKRLTAMLPVLMKAMEGFGDELEKATANMPQPGYPNR